MKYFKAKKSWYQNPTNKTGLMVKEGKDYKVEIDGEKYKVDCELGPGVEFSKEQFNKYFDETEVFLD